MATNLGRSAHCYGWAVPDSIASLDHQIIFARDKTESAEFLTSILALPPPEKQSIFLAVRLSNSSTLLYKTVDHEFPGQHYAFRVPPARFAAVLARLKARSGSFWATPKGSGIGELYELAGETGFYFHDPSGHQLEVLTDSAGRAGLT